MATTIDELIVRIKADTADLEKGLRKVKTSVNNADKQTQSLGDAFRKLRGPIAAVVTALGGLAIVANKIKNVGMRFEDLQTSLNAVFGSVKAGEKAFDDIVKFAEETPFQLETVMRAFVALKGSGIEPNIKQLKIFANIAAQATDQIGAFEALIRVTQRAATGGIQLEEINQLDDRGIPALKALKNEFGRTKKNLTEFTSDVANSTVVVNALAKGLDEMAGDVMSFKMENLSTKLSNLEIALNQAADAVFDEGGLGQIFKDFTDQAIADVKELTIRLKALFTGVPEDFFKAEDDAGRLAALNREIAVLERRRDETGTADAFTRLATGDKDAAGFRDLVGGFFNPEQTKENINKTITALVALKQEIIDTGKEERARLKTAQQEARDRDAAADAKAKQIELDDAVGRLLKKNADKATVLKEQIAQVDKALLQVLGGENKNFTESELNALLEKLNADLKELGKEDAEAGLGDLKQAVLEVSNAFTNDFVQGLMNGQSALVSFRDFAKSLVSQIITIFLQLEVVNRIINSVLGLSGNAALPTGGIISPAKNRAGGGSVNRNSAMVVGERGPEIFIPHSAGVIRNNHDSRNMMGGSGIVVNQSLNFSTGVVPTVRAEVQKMLPDISEVTKVAVLEASARGGSFRKGLIGA